jgi:hypothetical protein
MSKVITLENITQEDIIEMAKTIQQMEQLINEQRGYIIQLQTMIQQRNSQLKQAVQPSVGINTNNFISVEGTIDL